MGYLIMPSILVKCSSKVYISAISFFCIMSTANASLGSSLRSWPNSAAAKYASFVTTFGK